MVEQPRHRLRRFLLRGVETGRLVVGHDERQTLDHGGHERWREQVAVMVSKHGDSPDRPRRFYTQAEAKDLVAYARARGIRFTESRKAYGSPRSVSTNAHGFRIAVHRVTGEIRILHSVQATDAGVVINPAQVRGQIEGGVAQAIGFAITENFHVDDDGAMVNPNLRNYRIPTFADIPRTEIITVESHDSVGPMASKGIAESCVNPVAAALANALADATGVRYRSLPLSPERIYDRLPSGSCLPVKSEVG